MKTTNISNLSEVEIAKTIQQLTEDNQRLNEENARLKEKNRVATRRIRLIRRFLTTLSTGYQGFGDGDEYERGECKANERVTNVVNTIVSSVPDPELSYRSRWLMLKTFNKWAQPGTREKRRNKSR